MFDVKNARLVVEELVKGKTEFFKKENFFPF